MKLTKEILTLHLPCFVYYKEKRRNGSVSRIGLAVDFLGNDHVIVRMGKNTSDIYLLDELEIVNLNEENSN